MIRVFISSPQERLSSSALLLLLISLIFVPMCTHNPNISSDTDDDISLDETFFDIDSDFYD
jgi:hypothetical protein